MTASQRRTRTPWRTPWRTLALIAVGALLLGAGIGGAILRARHLRGAAFRGLEEALAANARQAAAGVGFWIGERRADAAVTGRHLLQFADQAGGLASPAAGLRMGKTLDVVRQHYGYRAAWVLDTAGTVVARSGPAGATLDPAERSAARASAMDGAPAVVGPFRGADGRPVLALVAALAGSEGKSLGAVAIEIDLEATLLPRIPVRLAGSETGQSRLVGRIGDEFVVISGSLKPPAAPFSRRLPWAQARTVAQLVTSGRDTAGVFVDFEHRRVLVAAHHVPGTRWGIVRSIDEAEVLAGYRDRLVAEIQAAIVAALLLALVALMGRRAVAARGLRDTAASRALLAEAQSLGRMGSWTWDPVRDRMTWTPELYRVLGHEPGTVVPSIEALRAAVDPEDQPAVQAAFDAFVAERAPFSIEHRVRRPDGTMRHVQATCRSVPRPGGVPGEPPIYLGVLADTTDRRELEARLVQAQKMQAVGLLAGGIAHDFNNMLTVVIGSCDLLADEVADPSPAMVEIRELRRAAERAASLTTQLLAFSRQQVVRMHVLDLNTTVAESETLIRRVIPEDIHFRAIPSDRPAWVRADPALLQQVLLNLALNARDAMPHGGALTFVTEVRSAGESGEEVVVSVRDTGTGMTPAVMARLFEPFFTTKDRGKGTGLGLSTAHGIVAQFGGDLSFESAPGQGSVFIVTLPHAARAGAPEALPVQGTAGRDGTETVLLVEDDAAVRRGTRRILQRHGYRVLEAADGELGVEVAATFDGVIHLLLTDTVMPNLTGGEVAQRVQHLRPGIKVILMSGYTDDAVLRRGLSDRRYAFLQKPFDRNELTAMVREALGPAA